MPPTSSGMMGATSSGLDGSVVGFVGRVAFPCPVPGLKKACWKNPGRVVTSEKSVFPCMCQRMESIQRLGTLHDSVAGMGCNAAVPDKWVCYLVEA